ncbi:hypothetical protein A2773_04490 [Candidatus Gottesmanbacteria bacterium RIFCSPHIGHO2_01_FULL_39_10]|uniref:Membrane protein 6-pyruvoyl-tetrahydropterin synthase-related domain-containing protein n=1 Tax=Candidatus Gottesmanbacteria bacterium RIFCSPHIGHO2_01_FULL_39_10 TaxID=1798375 RepID=A0A1F5ZRK7_9BACT|nr:MAG: hypothetical protein A2773_04490 [Candidatus Gottesmanbacteria bacterium RIFCSPHIGHO2_01_FULL_39_10]
MFAKLYSLPKKPLLIFSILTILFFFPIIFLNHVFYSGDLLTIYLPMKHFFIDSIKHGIFPLWNPYIFSGYPYFADISLDTYYLPTIILFIDGTLRGITYLIILHFIFSGYFAFKLGKMLKLQDLGALFFSITYTFSGLMVNYIVDPKRLFTVSLYPLFFYSLLLAFQKNKFFFTVLSSLALSLQIFSGHIQYVFIELLVVPVLLFWQDHTKQKVLRKCFVVLQILILAILFASIALIPALEFLPFTTRLDTSKFLSIYQGFSLNPVTLIRFVFADFFGIRNQGSAWSIMDTTNIGYLGVLPLLLIGLNIKKILITHNTKILLTLTVVSLLISFGINLPFFQFFIFVIPIFKFFRNPMVFLALYTFFASLLAGFALDFSTPSKNKNYLLKISILISVIMSMSVYLLINLQNNLPHKILIFASTFIQKKLSLFHTPEVDFLIAQFITANIFIVSVIILLGLLVKRKEVFIIITFIDLMYFNKGIMYTQNFNNIPNKTEIVSFLQKNISSFRYLSTSEQIPYSGMNEYFGGLALQAPFNQESHKQSQEKLFDRFLHEYKLLPPNFGSYYNLRTINGYQSFVIKDYFDYFQSSQRPNRLYQDVAKFNPNILNVSPDLQLSKIDLSKIDFNDRIFDELAVKYIVADRNLYLNHHNLVYKYNDINIYENTQVLPRAVVLDEKGSVIDSAKIIRANANNLTISAQKRGKLVLKDVNYSGWQAYLNGKKVSILPYKKIFRSIDLNSDKSSVEFRFEPKSFSYGAIISFLSITIAATYLVLIFLVKKHEKSNLA